MRQRGTGDPPLQSEANLGLLILGLEPAWTLLTQRHFIWWFFTPPKRLGLLTRVLTLLFTCVLFKINTFICSPSVPSVCRFGSANFPVEMIEFPF